MSFNNIGSYVCICGKEFSSSQSFNGHKAHCKEHQVYKHGSMQLYEQTKKLKGEKISSTNKQRSQVKKEQELNQWISEQHTCEKCGKVMTEKFGSGRFCSKQCANSRTNSGPKSKKVKSLNANQIEIKTHLKKLAEEEYNKHPKLCPICGEKLPYSKRNRHTCGKKDCVGSYISFVKKAQMSNIGNNNLFRYGNYKFGTYKGYECDSSWELAFVMYCLDHNIKITRNKTISFPYVFNGSVHLYFPDYLIDTNQFIEIKNYISKKFRAKMDYFPSDFKLTIIGKSEIKKFIDYAKRTYGENFTELYDKNFPNYMNYKKEQCDQSTMEA